MENECTCETPTAIICYGPDPDGAPTAYIYCKTCNAIIDMLEVAKGEINED